MYKKLLLSIFLLLNAQTTFSCEITITHHYTYTTPLSQHLVMGNLSTFLAECKYYNEKDICFALQEFIRLRPLNKNEIASPSIGYVLKHLHNDLTKKIKRVENQIKHQYRFDYQALATSAGSFSLGIILNALAYHYIQKRPKDISFLSIPCGMFGITFLCLSTIDMPNIFNPNRDNAYLKKYKNMLKFIKKLQTYNYPHDSKNIVPYIMLSMLLIYGLVTTCVLAPLH